MNTARGNRDHPEAERAEDASGGSLGRRRVLGGLAAIPFLSGVVVSAATASDAAAAPRGSAGSDADDLVLGVERRYNEPLLAQGTRLVLPAGVTAAPVLDYYTRPRLAGKTSAWPHLRAPDGSAVDASVIPERGAPTVVAMLSGFTGGWYEIRHAGGRADRVEWDAAAMPFVWLYGEFGGSDTHPYHRFYSLALQPMSASPYPLAIIR